MSAMVGRRRLLLLLLAAVLSLLAAATGVRADDIGLLEPEELRERIPEQMLKDAEFARPELSKEEEFSPQVPRSMRCDACFAVAHQLERNLERMTTLRAPGGKKRLDELQLLEALEDVCKSQGLVRRELERRKQNLDTPEDIAFKDARTIWDGYGVKVVDTLNRLTGEGLPANAETGVVMVKGAIAKREHKGKPWSGRLARFCETLVGELGEDELYQLFLETRPDPAAAAVDVSQSRSAASSVEEDRVMERPPVKLEDLKATELDIRRSEALAQYRKFLDRKLAPARFTEQVCGRLHRQDCVGLHRRRMDVLAPDNPMLPFQRLADPVLAAEELGEQLLELRRMIRREQQRLDRAAQAPGFVPADEGGDAEDSTFVVGSVERVEL